MVVWGIVGANLNNPGIESETPCSVVVFETTQPRTKSEQKGRQRISLL